MKVEDIFFKSLKGRGCRKNCFEKLNSFLQAKLRTIIPETESSSKKLHHLILMNTAMKKLQCVKTHSARNLSGLTIL